MTLCGLLFLLDITSLILQFFNSTTSKKLGCTKMEIGMGTSTETRNDKSRNPKIRID